jgi:hypothetical protein
VAVRAATGRNSCVRLGRYRSVGLVVATSGADCGTVMLDGVVRALRAERPFGPLDLAALVRVGEGAFPTDGQRFVQDLLDGDTAQRQAGG